MLYFLKHFIVSLKLDLSREGNPIHIFESLHFPLTRAEHLHDVYVSKIRHLVSWVFYFLQYLHYLKIGSLSLWLSFCNYFIELLQISVFMISCI